MIIRSQLVDFSEGGAKTRRSLNYRQRLLFMFV